MSSDVGRMAMLGGRRKSGQDRIPGLPQLHLLPHGRGQRRRPPDAKHVRKWVFGGGVNDFLKTAHKPLCLKALQFFAVKGSSQNAGTVFGGGGQVFCDDSTYVLELKSLYDVRETRVKDPEKEHAWGCVKCVHLKLIYLKTLELTVDHYSEVVEKTRDKYYL